MFGFDDDGLMFPWSNEEVMGRLGTAIIISTIFGALVGIALNLILPRAREED